MVELNNISLVCCARLPASSCWPVRWPPCMAGSAAAANSTDRQPLPRSLGKLEEVMEEEAKRKVGEGLQMNDKPLTSRLPILSGQK